jgi:hypothetical protein
MKKIILLLIIIPTILHAGNGPIKFEKFDDKAWHVWAGTFITAGSGWWIYKKTNSTWKACLGGAIIGGGAGVFKEAIWDKQWGLGVCSNSDAYHTFWGSAVGSMALRITIDIKQKHDIDKAYFENLRDSLSVERLKRFE